MNVFDILENENKKNFLPLAERMKPQSLEDFYGQENLNKNSSLFNMIKNDYIMSMILYGPSGSGKTSIARIISKMTRSDFLSINAIKGNINDVREALEIAKSNLLKGKRTILFIDEIHRFNKVQQDFLLPYIENSTFILIGATTMNPYFELNQALLSRCILYTINKLNDFDIKKILLNAINSEKGLKKYVIKIEDDALDFICILANGDARNALNILEISAMNKFFIKNEKIVLKKIDIKQFSSNKNINYDKKANEHYNTISAFIKSMRASDVNASLHYLARMIEGGEDINFICRRLLIFASEDIGNINPTAAILANSIVNSVLFVGMPESRILLSQLVIFLSASKKSNKALKAIDTAIYDVKNMKIGEIPFHLRDSHYKGANFLNYGLDYKYPPNCTEEDLKNEIYLPDELKDKIYYS